MIQRTLRKIAATTALVPLLGLAPAAAQVIDLEGRTVTIVHNASPGGSTGLISQLAADAWSQTMEGNPTIVVQSVEGGALSRGILQVMNARPDGRTLGWVAWQGSTRVLDPVERQIPFQDFGLIGGVGGSVFIAHTSTDPERGMNSAEDLPQLDHYTFGGYSPRSGPAIRTAAAMDMLGVEWSFVSGMSGDTPLEAARQRGEIDGYPVTAAYYLSTLAPGPVAEGTDIPLFYFTAPNEEGTGLTVDPSLEGMLPFDQYYEQVMGEAPEGPLWDMIMYHARVTDPINWLVVAPPGTPDEHLQMLRESFAEALESEEFLAGAEELLGMVPTVSYYDDVQAIVDEIANTPEEMRQLQRDYISRMER